MKRLLLIFAFLCFASSDAMAAGQGGGPGQLLAPGQILRGHFEEQHFFKGSSRAIASEGTFVFSSQRGLIWMMARPIPFTFVITPKGMTQLLSGVPVFHETAAQSARFLSLLVLVNAAFEGRWNALDRDFSISRSGDERAWHLRIIPHADSQAAVLVKSILADGDLFLDRAEVIESNGGQEAFVFSQQKVSMEPLTAEEESLWQYSETTN